MRAADDAWAVGTQYTTTVHGSYDVVLLEHWDGTAWQVFPGDNPGEFGDHLAGVTVLAPDNAWAVGDQTTASPGQVLTLIEHWDGTRWQAVPSANPKYTVNALEAIAAAAPNDLWAVGYFNDAPGDAALLEHWDGTVWTPAYVLPEAISRLHGVALRASNDGWAVGACVCGGGGTNTTLILHWDGSAWGSVPSPNVGAGDNELMQVVALAADDVWAVGDYWNGQGYDTLIEHWDGQIWSVVPSPNIGGDSNQLRGLTALGPTDLWAVGSSVSGSVMRPLALHWDGQQWTQAVLPDLSGPYAALWGVGGAAPADVWASGADGASGQPLILHYAGGACPASSATATGTVEPPPPSATQPLPTSTRLPVPSATPAGVGTAIPTPGAPSPSATPCAIAFRDVDPGAYFAAPVADLACRGVISGYGDGTFRPYSNTTRAQMVKIVILGFHLTLLTPPGGSYTFADVPPAHPFFAVIETAARAGLVSGYGCGGPGEPCDAQQRAYFRPYAPVTRGQLSKMAVLGAGWPLSAPAVPSFRDVPVGAPFYAYVETAHCAGLLSGYADGTFRPGNAATRGQIAKIVDLALTGSGPCGPPAPAPPIDGK